jgi:hypothetical protein
LKTVLVLPQQVVISLSVHVRRNRGDTLNTPEGKQRDELLQQIKSSSMAVWQHINMLGEYDFSDERVNTITQFHLPKILKLKVE